MTATSSVTEPRTQLEQLIALRAAAPIHLYIDNSGSTLPIEQKAPFLALATLALAYNRELTVSTFSHELSAAASLDTSGATPESLWIQYKDLHKAYGGGDAGVVWADINAHDPEGLKINIMVTDFGLGFSDAFNSIPQMHYLSLANSNSEIYRPGFIQRIDGRGGALEDFILDDAGGNLKPADSDRG